MTSMIPRQQKYAHLENIKLANKNKVTLPRAIHAPATMLTYACTRASTSISSLSFASSVNFAIPSFTISGIWQSIQSPDGQILKMQIQKGLIRFHFMQPSKDWLCQRQRWINHLLHIIKFLAIMRSMMKSGLTYCKSKCVIGIESLEATASDSVCKLKQSWVSTKQCKSQSYVHTRTS